MSELVLMSLAPRYMKNAVHKHARYHIGAPLSHSSFYSTPGLEVTHIHFSMVTQPNHVGA